MAQQSRKAMADVRALEEQAERVNPVSKKGVPSMGVSQMRGGNLLGQDGHGQRMVGAGTKKGQARKTARKAYEDVGKAELKAHEMAHEALDARGMGKHLGEHLHDLHGAGFWSDFKDGFNMVMRPVAGIAKAVIPGAAPVLGAIGYGKKRGGAKPTMKPALGNTSVMDTASFSDKMTGGNISQSGRYEGQGGTGGAMSGCGKGGRAARAMVVKQVMADKGLSMIEASKYVKAHGLY